MPEKNILLFRHLKKQTKNPHSSMIPVLSCRRRRWGPSTSPTTLRTSSCTKSAARSVCTATTSWTATAARTTGTRWRTEATRGCWGQNPESLRSSRCTLTGPSEFSQDSVHHKKATFCHVLCIRDERSHCDVTHWLNHEVAPPTLIESKFLTWSSSCI